MLWTNLFIFPIEFTFCTPLFMIKSLKAQRLVYFKSIFGDETNIMLEHIAASKIGMKVNLVLLKNFARKSKELVL